MPEKSFLHEFNLSFPAVSQDLFYSYKKSLQTKEIDDFFNNLKDCIDKKDAIIKIDCLNIKSINSALIAKIIYFEKKAGRSNCKILLINLAPQFIKIFKSLNIEYLIDS